MLKKAVPIGIEFYKQMIDHDYYYVDKTMMIKEILDNTAAVTLFTRPRRFGKTLAMNMLKTFFEDERDLQGNKVDNSRYFQGKAIAILSECLKKYHNKNAIILIDEYDVPLENAYFAKFYDQMVAFIRSLFESALKTNENLEFAVITGCLRISRESIFTGLDNLKIVSILRNDCAEYFGFTPAEVYNPWSVINYVDENKGKTEIFPRLYWSNTLSNSIVKELIENSDFVTKKEIESLIAGETIEKPGVLLSLFAAPELFALCIIRAFFAPKGGKFREKATILYLDSGT